MNQNTSNDQLRKFLQPYVYFMLTHLSETRGSSMTNYNREMESLERGERPTWDDERNNTAFEGIPLGFIHPDNSIEFWLIDGILPSHFRRSEWGIQEHQSRRVLVLSRMPVFRTTFDTLREVQGYHNDFFVKGTKRYRVRQ